MDSRGGPPVSNPIAGTWRNLFADKGQKGRDLQKFDRVEELICDFSIDTQSKVTKAINILLGKMLSPHFGN
jgi:hypothetical protein